MTELDPRYEVIHRTQKQIFRESRVAPDDFGGIIELLSPRVIADHLELDYWEVEEIPPHRPGFRTAGILNRANGQIIVSKEFPVEQMRLTGMHEIVHWVHHSHLVMHRDRPIIHQSSQDDFDPVESEATRIACLCLMPEKMVKEQFAAIFRLQNGQQLQLDEQTAFYLEIDIDILRKMGRRQKALALATAHSFGCPVLPLHKAFKVSPTAMAIRLEELNLIAPDRRRGTPTLRIVP